MDIQSDNIHSDNAGKNPINRGITSQAETIYKSLSSTYSKTGKASGQNSVENHL